MTSDSYEEAAQNHPQLVAQRSNFQWGAALNAASLTAGWHNHLTRYLVATATASVSFERQEPLPLLEVKGLDDPLNLYQITLHEQVVEVQVNYRALSQAFMEAPYDCHLLLKTEVGGRFVTLPAPKPPDQAEWKHVLKKLWFQLLLAEDALLVIPDAAHASAKRQPLYTFRLHADLNWDVVEPPRSGGVLSDWQRELRLTPDPADPHMLRAQVGWNDSQSVSSPALVAITRPEQPSRREVQQTRQRPPQVRGIERVTQPLLLAPLPGHERRWGFSRVRIAGVIAAVLLLVLIAGVAVGATHGGSGASNPLIVSNHSPTAGSTPSALPSTTPPATNAPTASPAPGSTPKPNPTPTKRPTATPTPKPTPTPPPTPTPTPSPTPTPTPSTMVNFVVTPLGFGQSCASGLSSLGVTLDNSGSNVAVSWQVIGVGPTDPMGNSWASVSSSSGTVGAGQISTLTIFPAGMLCDDLAGATGAFSVTISYSAPGQSNQVTVDDTVSP